MLELFDEDVLDAVPFDNGVDEVLVRVVGEVMLAVLPVAEGVRSAAVVLAADVVDAVTVLVLPDAEEEDEIEDAELETTLLDELEEEAEPPVRWKGNDS